MFGSEDWGSWVRHCCHPAPVLHASGGFILAVQSSPVHSKVEFYSHQSLTLEALQACKGLLSTVTFSRKVKFGIWAVLASSSVVPLGPMIWLWICQCYSCHTYCSKPCTHHTWHLYHCCSLLRDSVPGIREPDPFLSLYEGITGNLHSDMLSVTFLWSFPA